MDREETIRIAKAINSSSISLVDITRLIKSYCIEHGKENRDIDMFIMVLTQSPITLPYYLNYALDYYKRKFNIITLYSKGDSDGNRKILQIF